MKYSHRSRVFLAALGIVCAFLLRAELATFTENAQRGSAVESALFRRMDLPGGAVLARRAPLESVAGVTALVQSTPDRAELYAIRAQEEERELKFEAAETDWQHAAQLAREKRPALMDLADFYQRRVKQQLEIKALLDAARLPAAGRDQFLPSSSQPSWAAFERARRRASASNLNALVRRQIFEAWIQRYPAAPEPYGAFLDTLLEEQDRNGAAALVTKIQQAFPNNTALVIESEAKLGDLDGQTGAALGVYARHFTPLWPADLRTAYYQQLSAAHQLRAFLSSARANATANPTALAPALQSFFYYEQAGDRARAAGELRSFEQRRFTAHFASSPADLFTLAPLYERASDYDQAARAYYSVYELSTASAAEKENALAALVSLLLDNPEQSLQLGRRDLSLYRNVASMDREPGFLNGILSLALNTTFPQYQYQTASQNAVAYFHRAAGSRFLERLKREYPNGTASSSLEAKLFSAYAVYGEQEALLRLVPDWVQHNPASPELVSTALLLGDAYASASREADEFALYDSLLAQLSAKNQHVPLGPQAVLTEPPSAAQPRSSDYARVLDRYITRLTESRHLPEVLTLYRKEIGRNPDDPGLYSRLALFVEQNRLDAELAQTYRQAFARFQDSTWAGKLARLYLRRKEYAAYQALLRGVTTTFSGTALANFLPPVEPNAKLNPELYRQINLYAHQRFPHNLVFTRNLLAAYQTKGTADSAAYEKLLRENWFYDAGLRQTFFEYLSQNGKLQTELAALPSLESAGAQRNVAAVQMRAEGEAWLTRYQESAPAFVQLASFAPGDRDVAQRAITVKRSLAPGLPPSAVSDAPSGVFATALRLAEQDVTAAPGDLAAITRVGEILADREMYNRALPWWDRVAATEPGLATGYLESATVFWDYFRFDDALRQIADARIALRQPALFGYEAGAIYESKGELKPAVHEYVVAALAAGSSNAEDSPAERRLMLLSGRTSAAQIIAVEMNSLLSGGFNRGALNLQIALLEKRNRRAEIGALLREVLPRANTTEEAEQVRSAAGRLGFDDLTVLAFERAGQLTPDPVEKLQLRLDLASFREGHGDSTGAERDLSTLLDQNPEILGVIRANVDFYWRQRESRKAVAVLTAAAGRARDPFERELVSEAAAKAADSGEYTEARTLLDRLLTTDPYDADLLARKAATYSMAGDANGLVQYYAAELKAIQSSRLAPADKANRSAALRRGYVLALISGAQNREALEQYELLLNQYAEDGDLTRTAARFAERHQLAADLTGYYQKASADSPRDYRWPLLLARIEKVFGHYPEALSAYAKAVYVRPDRIDILESKADLELRLLHFQDALATEAKLYELSFHNVRYLEQQASLQARLGNQPEALRLLRAAYLDARPDEPDGYAAVMRQLSAWKMFDAVDSTYQQLLPVLANRSAFSREAVSMEGAALASLHRPQDAFRAVTAALSTPAVPKQAASDTAYSEAVGAAALVYLTPEEKSQWAGFLRTQRTLAPGFDRYRLTRASGLPDVAALAIGLLVKRNPQAHWTVLQEFEAARLDFKAAAELLEAAARTARPDYVERQILQAALENYGNAGDATSQLRVAEMLSAGSLSGTQFSAIFVDAGVDLPARLVTLAKTNPSYADAVLTYLFASHPEREVRAALEARGRALPPVWNHAYSALTGFFFASPQPWAPQSFDAVLGPRLVGSALHAPAALSPHDWFYYAARYGEYLSRLQRAGAADLLPAELEAQPAASNSYVRLGEMFVGLSQFGPGLDLYRRALALSPQRGDIYDHMALAELGANNREQAVADWRECFRLLALRVEAGPLPPEYWTSAQHAIEHVNKAGLTVELRPDVTSLIRAYTNRNGTYNVEPFVEGILTQAADPARATEWILDLSREANIDALANAALNSNALSAPAKDPVYRFRIVRAEAQAAAASGNAADDARERVTQSRLEYVQYLYSQEHLAEAWNVLYQIQPPERRPKETLLEIGALSGHFDEILSGYHSAAQTAPPGEIVLQIAAQLAARGEKEAALRLREFEYERELDSDLPTAAAYFGLAQVRIDQKRAPEALDLMQKAVVTSGSPFENLSEAIRLSETAGLQAAALRYAGDWKTAEPWNSDAQLAFARLSMDPALLNSVRQSPAAPYRTRCEAAAQLRSLKQAAAGPAELDLLTHATLSAAESERPYFIQARLLAAQTVQDSAERIRLYKDAIALDISLRGERLALAETALLARQNALGLAALESYSSPGEYAPSPQAGSTDSLLSRVQELAAAVFVTRRDFARAIATYNQLLASAPVGDRPRLQKLLAAAQTANKLSELNASRQPVVTKDVTQPSIVRPRLDTLGDAGEMQ